MGGIVGKRPVIRIPGARGGCGLLEFRQFIAPGLRMQLTLPDFSTARVLVAGDLMLDRYWYGSTGRISPEAPVPVVHVGGTEERPGGAANVALNIAALQGRVNLLGLTGDDEAASMLRRQLLEQGVDCAFREVAGHPTICKLRVLSRRQQLIRMDFERPFSDDEREGFGRLFREHLQAANTVVLSDYAKGTLADAPGMIRAAREAGCRVLVDPKGSDFSRYRGADVLTPNQAEFEAVVGHCENDAALEARGRNLLRELHLGAVLVTRGERGMLLITGTGKPLHLPAHAREVFDVTGAGDTVISVLAAALSAGSELPVATALANLAAGLVVAKVGTATVTVAELRRALHGVTADGYGTVGRAELELLASDARAQGERLVFTNGCFDILHAGHVAYLQKARALGDRLIVAVNDDDSVRRLKGPERPLNPVEQRMMVLAAMGCVDWVVPFSEDTPAALIELLRPDVLVKGGDYRPEDIVGADTVTAAGGEVVVLDFVDGVSTTGIIERIRNKP